MHKLRSKKKKKKRSSNDLKLISFSEQSVKLNNKNSGIAATSVQNTNRISFSLSTSLSTHKLRSKEREATISNLTTFDISVFMDMANRANGFIANL